MTIPVRLSKRAKRVSILVHQDGRAEVVVPARRVPSRISIERFVAKHKAWVLKQQARQLSQPEKEALTHPGVSREMITEQTENLIEHLIAVYARVHPFEIQQFVLRAYRAQWGSCSSKKRLGFHYKLSLLPEELASYIVAHELAHTYHMNHGPTFWSLVALLCPSYKSCRKRLARYTL